MREEDSLQIDFMATIHGLKSFAAVRSRAITVSFEDCQLLVAHLADVIRSKRAARRPRDVAVLEILERTLDEQEKTNPPRET
jgi:hypothetical protein